MNQKSTHSSVGASGRHRWSQCPASVKLSQDIPNTESPLAKEGYISALYGRVSFK